MPASVTLPLTVITPGDAPGLSVPATAMSPLTVPADPKVAPRPTAIRGAVIVDPASPTRRPPVRSMPPSAAVPAMVA